MGETGFFKNQQGLNFLERRWDPPGEVRGHVVIIHGFGEHSGRYQHIADFLNEEGFAVHAYDHRYHGQSPGKRGYIQSFTNLLNDLDNYLDHIRPRFNDLPVVFLGHSMGGLVLSLYAETRTLDVDGLVFSSTLMQTPPDVSPLLLALAPYLSRIIPWAPAADLDPNFLSRDKQVVRAYEQDPLVYHGRIKVRTGSQINQSIQRAREKLHLISLPAYVIHGTDDGLAPCDGSRYLYEQLGAEDKTLKIYEGGYHELFNDLEKTQVLDALRDWIVAHTIRKST